MKFRGGDYLWGGEVSLTGCGLTVLHDLINFLKYDTTDLHDFVLYLIGRIVNSLLFPT